MARWWTRAGEYPIRRKESPRPGGQAYLPLGPARAVILHTTEGPSVEGAWGTLNEKAAAPHFIVGENRIVQCRPLTAQAATVHNHNGGFIQIEAVGYSKLGLHDLTPETFKPLAALADKIHVELDIPLRRPDQWSDKLPAGVWASNNPRRRSRLALSFHGWVGHIEIPDQEPSWHWDPGSFNYTALFAAARGKEEDDMTKEQLETLKDCAAFVAGVTAAMKGLEPNLETKRPEFRRGFRLGKRVMACNCPATGEEKRCAC